MTSTGYTAQIFQDRPWTEAPDCDEPVSGAELRAGLLRSTEVVTEADDETWAFRGDDALGV